MIFNELWADLPPEIRKQFELSSKTLEIKRGDFVYRQSDEPKGLYFVKSGLVGLIIHGSESGKEHLLRFFKQNQFFGHRALFSEEGYHGSTVALESTVIKLVPRDAVLHAIKSHPILLKDVVRVLAKELRRSELQRVLILENQILTRTAQALIYLKELHPEHNWTRQEIANFCASTVSTIIKALSQLETMGLIEQDGRKINILDRKRLLALQDSDQ